MKGLEETPDARFEDLVDMMDHAYELMQKAIFQYCLCVKVSDVPMCSNSFKALLMGFVESEFEDMFPRITPCIETNSEGTVIYAILKKKA